MSESLSQQLSHEPTLKRSDEAHRFALSQEAPRVSGVGGTVTVCNADNFPVLKGQAAAVFLLRLTPGGLREPHWHPNAWEIDFVVKGKARLGIVNPDDTYHETILEAGDIGFIPQGFAHYIECVGDEPCEITVTFNNDKPSDIGLSTMFAGMPTRTFSATFGVAEEKMEGFRKPDSTIYVAREN